MQAFKKGLVLLFDYLTAEAIPRPRSSVRQPVWLLSGNGVQSKKSGALRKWGQSYALTKGVEALIQY
jgi:hypothetical protein